MAGDDYAGESSGSYGNGKKPERSDADAKNGKLVARVRRRKCIMFDADETNRDDALDDIRFLHEPGAQWDKVAKENRGDRPCYEFNELRVKALRIINNIRANRPQGKVLAVEDGDVKTAETRAGLIRNIWTVSDGDSVTDYAADYQVSGGMGAWRVETVWNDDSGWNQDIRVRPFKNPFCLWRDPAATDPLGLDADDWIVSEKITKKSYEERWPDVSPVSFEEGDDRFDDNDSDWYGEEGVRIAEYWYKEPTTKTLALLSNGQTVEIKEAKKGDTNGVTLADGSPLPDVDTATGQPLTIKRRRTVKSHKIMMCIVSGSAVLEQPTEWPGKYFPFIQVFGEWRVINGKVVWHGLPRFSKDAQRMQNVTMTAIAESVMSAPLSHFWATEKQALGHVDKWKEAHKKLIPFMPYNGDPAANGPPQRMQPADVPVALMEMRGIAADLIKGTTGIFDASLGQQSNETSGRAINARQIQGEIATFNYGDNMSKGVRLTWIILDDLVGKIYTGERSVRILGVDLAEKYVKVNTFTRDPKTGEMVPLNDLTRGKYDVTMTTGPSFSTQRQEATQLYSELGQRVPAVWTVAGDLIFKSMDLPYADQIADRLKLLLPPPVQKMLASNSQNIDPAAVAVMAQAETMMQNVQQLGAQAQDAMMKAKDEQTKAKQASSDVEIKIAQLKAAEASLAKDVADFQKSMAEQALLAAQQGTSDEFRQQMAEALAGIQEQATALFTQYAEQLQAVHAQAVASTAAVPRKRAVKLARQPDGSYQGEIADTAAEENAAPEAVATA